jgi:hypothetical protein
MELLVKDYKSIKFEIDLLKAMQQDFKISNSNYTTTIEINETKKKYITKEMHKKSFLAFNMIKKDINELNIDVDNILVNSGFTSKSIYFDVKPMIIPFKSDKVINIDIKNAYPSVLNLSKLITEKTYNYLKTLKKSQKLPALGMLASKKVNFYFKGGNVYKMDIDTSPYRDVFTYLVRYIDFMMASISEIVGDKFVFFWVDGIYLKGDVSKEKLQEVFNFITGLGFQYHYEILRNFNLTRTEDKVNIEFEKEGKQKKFCFLDKNINREINRLIENLNKDFFHK